MNAEHASINEHNPKLAQFVALSQQEMETGQKTVRGQKQVKKTVSPETVPHIGIFSLTTGVVESKR